MASLNGFNRISAWYDRLATLVFGDHILAAQTIYLNEIPPRSNVLILGGGTGSILREMLKADPSCHIWYIEASSSMLDLSRAKLSSFSRSDVHFIHGTEESIPGDIQFDVVVTAFFLDLFPSDQLRAVIQKVSSNLKPGALWLATDFVSTGKWHHALLLRLMYSFFRLVAGIKAKSLPHWQHALIGSDLTMKKSAKFFDGFIAATTFVKNAR